MKVHGVVNTEGVPQDLRNNEFNISERETRDQKVSNTFCLLFCLFGHLQRRNADLYLDLRPSKHYQQVQFHPETLICMDLTF